MEGLSKYTKQYEVMARDVDFHRKMKLSTIFTYFEDVASLNAASLGIGFDKIRTELNLAWVLTRIKVEITRYPVWNETVIVETWPHEPQKVKFNRDYYIKDVEGNILVRATSIWAIIDINTRELQKTDRLKFTYPEWNVEKAITGHNEKLKPVSEPVLSYKKVIGGSDIDMNEHLNNSKYVDYIMDCFTMDELKAYTAESIDVNYINEALPGDTILLKKDNKSTRAKADENVPLIEAYKDGDTEYDRYVYIEGMRESDDTVIFKAKLTVISTK